MEVSCLYAQLLREYQIPSVLMLRSNHTPTYPLNPTDGLWCGDCPGMYVYPGNQELLALSIGSVVPGLWTWKPAYWLIIETLPHKLWA